MGRYQFVPVNVPDDPESPITTTTNTITVLRPVRRRPVRSFLHYLSTRKMATFLVLSTILVFFFVGFLSVFVWLSIWALITPRTFGYRKDRYGRYFSVRYQRERR